MWRFFLRRRSWRRGGWAKAVLFDDNLRQQFADFFASQTPWLWEFAMAVKCYPSYVN